ncbi:MAG TPA: M14 family metallopeptidase [Vicinamibacterales bacterium]|jgi:hypothetical protein
MILSAALLVSLNLIVAAGAGLFATQVAEIPVPSQFLKLSIGGNGVLASYDQIVAYWRAVDALSDRIVVQELGKTTMGRPYVAAIVTSPENQRRLEEYRLINHRLYDARRTSDSQAQELISRGKTIVAIQMGIHSDEVAAPQLSLELAHQFATDNSARMLEILDQTIIILSPSHNPDGTQMVAEWNQRTLGTPYEGSVLPFLYHHYVGHDNNRDWYMFTQAESRITVGQIWNRWHPQISHDLHQMSPDGARAFVPPYLDPVDPNIDPILREQTNALGSRMAAELAAKGKDGVVTNAIYDLWTPARAYVNYHGGVRILTEVAGVRLASPVTLSQSSLRPGIGFDPRRASWNFPRPWSGGAWRMRDIMDYQHVAVDALLDHAARNRVSWLTRFWQVSKRASSRSGGSTERRQPYAVVIPAAQRDPLAVTEMLRALQLGDVEVHRARAAFRAGNGRYPAGTHVILMAQPAGAFAKTLTEVQRYPDVRPYAGAPPQQPYDVTAYTMPLLMGVTARQVTQPFDADLELVPNPVPAVPGTLGPTSRGGYTLAHDSAGTRALIRLLKGQVRVGWARQPFVVNGKKLPAGTIVVPEGQPGARDLLAGIVRTLPVKVGVTDGALPPVWSLRLPRVGLYRSYAPSIDEGWTRWILDQWALPYSTLENGDIRNGQATLRTRFDVIVLPDQYVTEIVDGLGSGQVPPEYAGGIGDEGVGALRSFVEQGGTLVALDSASSLPVQRFGLPVENASHNGIYGPGSILRAQVDVGHPIGYGSESGSIAWFEHSLAFRARGNARSVVTYARSSELLLSGWLMGGEHLAGTDAVVEAPLGRGRVILFGFRPQYRAQTWATFGLFFNALFYSTTTSH